MTLKENVRHKTVYSEVVTLGETMVAFAPGSVGPLRYVADYKMKTAGAETNTAIGISKLGHSAGWISRLGDDEFGHYILNFTRGEGVDTSRVVFDGQHPSGVMFKQFNGFQQTRVTYYRSGSAASHLSPEDIDCDYLQNCRIFHYTGITPVLSDSCRLTAEKAAAAARQGGAMISFDPNIRMNLWKGNDHTPLIRGLALDADILMIGLDEALTLFGTDDLEKLRDIAFNAEHMQYLAVKDGANGAWVSTKNQTINIPPHPCSCIDPVGAGDAFNAAFLCGILEDRPLSHCGTMAGIAGALATQTVGDIEGYLSRKQLDDIIDGNKIVLR